MDKNTIGIFDSGLGGLSAYSVFRALMPKENIIYFADTGRNPYGTRPPEQLRIMAEEDLAFLLRHQVRAVIAACGTMSANAPDVLQRCSVPVVNVLDPSIGKMADIPGSGPLAILATDASIRSGVFASKLRAAAPDREVLPIACQDFVSLCEAGITDESDARVTEAVSRYLRPVKEMGADGILLGCTHFDILEEPIRSYLGSSVRLISAAACAAHAMAAMLTDDTQEQGEGDSIFYTSGSVEEFEEKASAILKHPIRAFKGTAGEDYR